MLNELLDWLFDFFVDGSKMFTYLFTPIFTIGDFSFSAVGLLSFTGLTTYLVIAIVKWGVS